MHATIRGLAALALPLLAACSTTMPAPAVTPAPVAVPAPTTLLVRLGNDTLGLEQYTRTDSRMEGALINRSPFTTIARYAIQLGANSAPVAVDYSLRRGDGTVVQGTIPALSLRFAGDSVFLVGHRANGDTARVNLARGEIQPFVNGSYGLFELALARLIATHRDSATFALVPLNFNVRNTMPMAIRLLPGDSATIDWFGFPVYVRHDGRGHLLAVDGRPSTVKVVADRVAAVDVDSLARVWTVREQSRGALGLVSPRDTVNATVGQAHLWVDYGRPALRGRDVWRRGVLGDTIWRAGANAATQLHTDAPLLIGGQVVPAGTYSLWIQATADGYHLIVNKQFGQWGTEYQPARDLIRVPLRESATAPVERFTIGVAPQGTESALLTFAWGTKTLSVPVATR